VVVLHPEEIFMADEFSITFVNDFGSDVRLQVSSGPNDPHAGGCVSNPVRYDDVLKAAEPNNQYLFTTLDSNVCWRRSSGPGTKEDVLPDDWNIIEQGVDFNISVKMSDQV
jgi:hypothetical protein